MGVKRLLSTAAIFSAFASYIFGTCRDNANIITQQHGFRRRLSTMVL